VTDVAARDIYIRILIALFWTQKGKHKKVLHVYQIMALISTCELFYSFVSYRWKARALLRNKPYLDDHGNLNKE
jgi:hypothetical protein